MAPTHETQESSRGIRRWTTALFVLSGIVPLLGLLSRPPDTMLLIYTVFVAAFLCRRHLAQFMRRAPGPFAAHLILLFLISGSLTEIIAWSNNYLKAAPEPALFHPQLIPDLIIGVGFYGGWAIAWLFALRWFRFTVCEAFLITGFQGIFFEQLGAVFRAMLSALNDNPLFALLMGIYVFAVHGSIVGLALAPFDDHPDQKHKSRHWIRYPVVVVLMVTLAFAGAWLVSVCTLVFGGLPPKRSITEYPFW